MKYLPLLLLLTGCFGNHPLDHNGKVYNCYGAFDKDEEKKDNVVYEIDIPNMVTTILLFETAAIPVWHLGWNTYCPVKVLEE